MSEKRITRAQAEAAEHAAQRLMHLALQVQADSVPFGWSPGEDYRLVSATLRAYFAQHQTQEVFCVACGMPPGIDDPCEYCPVVEP